MLPHLGGTDSSAGSGLSYDFVSAGDARPVSDFVPWTLHSWSLITRDPGTDEVVANTGVVPTRRKAPPKKTPFPANNSRPVADAPPDPAGHKGEPEVDGLHSLQSLINAAHKAENKVQRAHAAMETAKTQWIEYQRDLRTHDQEQREVPQRPGTHAPTGCEAEHPARLRTHGADPGPRGSGMGRDDWSLGCVTQGTGSAYGSGSPDSHTSHRALTHTAYDN